MRKYELNETEALAAFRCVSSHCAALKNWLVSAVEERDYERANKLATELRAYEKLYAKLNVEVHRDIDSRAA